MQIVPKVTSELITVPDFNNKISNNTSKDSKESCISCTIKIIQKYVNIIMYSVILYTSLKIHEANIIPNITSACKTIFKYITTIISFLARMLAKYSQQMFVSGSTYVKIIIPTPIINIIHAFYFWLTKLLNNQLSFGSGTAKINPCDKVIDK